MTALSSRMVPALFALGALALSAIISTEVRAQAPAVDPAAVQILKRMTDYLGSLKQFSMHTQINIEDLLASGQRIDEDVAASVIVSRPNKLRAERRDRKSTRLNSSHGYNSYAIFFFKKIK